MPDFLDGPELLSKIRSEIPHAKKVDLAVAFWGAGATENLGIKRGKGIRIICNLTHGGTNPKEIQTIIDLGADVRQLNNLHAKIGVVGNISFLGSSNMSTNGLGSEGVEAQWREANVLYSKARPEIVELFDTYWKAATGINEDDLKAAEEAWLLRQKNNALSAAKRGVRSFVEILRHTPDALDALNVRMAVYEPIKDKKEKEILDDAEETAIAKYGEKFEVFWDWDSMVKDAGVAYLVSFILKSRGEISYEGLYRRNVHEFPDFQQGENWFNAHYQISDIEGVKLTNKDIDSLRAAFVAYVKAGAKGEEDGDYNFPISALSEYLPPVG